MKAPTRLSVDTMPPHLFGRVDVFFDGVMIDKVIAYDVPEGWAEVYLHDENGHILIDGEDAATKKMHGRVTAVLRGSI